MTTAADQSRWHHYRAGFINSLATPALVLTMSFIGYGALTKEAGFSIYLSLFTTLAVYALPGQVVLADQALHGATVTAAAFAVTLTSVRLLPLTASLIPILRNDKMPKWMAFVASHFIAVTVWVESMRQLPSVKRPMRIPYYFGLCTALVAVSIFGTVTGYYLAASVPTEIKAGLLFLTPMYFFISLITVAVSQADKYAVALGLILGPIFFALMPGFDLFVTGLIGGTIAYGASRWISLKS